MLPIFSADQLDSSVLQRRTIQAPNHNTRDNTRVFTWISLCIGRRIWKGLRQDYCDQKQASREGDECSTHHVHRLTKCDSLVSHSVAFKGSARPGIDNCSNLHSAYMRH